MSRQNIRIRRGLTRREFISLSAASATAALLAACGAGATPTTAVQPTSAPTKAAQTSTTASQTAGAASKTTTSAQTSAARTTATAATTAATPGAGQGKAPTYTGPKQEAPALADLVKQGKLPAVDQRLPKNPLVVQPVEKVGKYGGTWHAALLGGQDTAWLTRTIDNENLVRWDINFKEVIPNIAESFEASSDATEYTFKLREGMKWSDGQPFTADDIIFYFDDYLMNKDLNPTGLPSYLQAGKEPPKVTKTDDYTVKFTFAAPNGLFLQNLATPSGNDPTRFPAHYLKQFHKKYADPAKLDQLMKENNAEDWVKLFRLKGAGIPGTPYNAQWQNKDLPSILGWVLTTPYGGDVQQVVAERNPYYWKIDPSGNQLPYLDKVIYAIAQDAQVLVLKAASGEIDMQDRNIGTNQNKAVLTDNQQKGQYHFFNTVPSSENTTVIALNWNHKDPTTRKIYQDKDFRIGLSYAINRQEVIDTVYVGQGEPAQVGPPKDSPYYLEQLVKQYVEYDVVKANQYLDKSYSKKDSQGFRLGPDGKQISVIIEVTNSPDPTWPDVIKLVVGYWQKVGINAQMKNEDRSLLYTRKDANDCDAVVWSGAAAYIDVLLDPRWYFPFSHESNFAQAWQVWFNNPSGAGAQTPPEEPPAPVKQQMDLYRQLNGTGDPAKQRDIMMQILKIAADQFYVFGISTPTNGYGVVKNNFHNVPKSMIAAWLWPTPAPTNCCQYYIE